MGRQNLGYFCALFAAQMIHQPSKRIATLSESATLAMAARVRACIAQGRDVIDLSLGEPDFSAPQFIAEAAKAAIDGHFDHYTPVAGYPELRAAIAHKFKRDNGLAYEPDQIVVSTGAKQSLANLCLSILNPGDEAVIPAPYWVSYPELVRLAEGVPVTVPTTLENRFKITAEQLESALSGRTRLFLFSSPANPSGSAYTERELAALAAVLARHPQVIAVSDEVYEHIHYGNVHQSLARFAQIADRVVTVNGLSKAFAMTGWRIGYMGAPKWLADACTKLQGQLTANANAIAQRAAITALEADPKKIRYRVDAFRRRRDLVIAQAREIKAFQTLLPDGAFYIFPDVSKCFGKAYRGTQIGRAWDLSLYLLEHAGVATVAGEAFGTANGLRISYAASEAALREAFKRMKHALD